MVPYLNRNGDHEAFTDQSDVIFALIRARIKFESEEIFPVVEQHFKNCKL